MGTVEGASFAFPFSDFEKRAVETTDSIFTRGAALDQPALRFLQQMHEDAVAEDLEHLSVDDMVALSSRFWKWAQQRPASRTKIRLTVGKRADGRPLGRDILEIVTADKPFLVDSVMGEINQQGVDILAMFHPIVAVERDESGARASGGHEIRESMIQVHVEQLDEGTRARLLSGVRATLSDVDIVVADHGDMRAQMDRAIEELENAPTPASRGEVEECVAFLRWLHNEHFAFLGCRVYEFPIDEDGRLRNEEPDIDEETGRGVLRDPASNVLRRGSEPAILTPAIQEFLREPTPLIVAKSNMRSRVHRRVYMDYIGVKRYREDGQVIGETRFVGLFTADAYLASVHDVPLIRRKVRRVLEHAEKSPDSHSYKRLKNIVETYPRDELFQSEEHELLEMSLGILHLFDRPRPKVLVRRDRFDRFASVFVFVPRERYTSNLRVQVGRMLASAFGGRLSAFYPSFGEGALARVHFIIGLNPSDHLEPDIADLERRIVEMSRTWADEFVRVVRRDVPVTMRPRLAVYGDAFSAGYRETFDGHEAIADAGVLEGVHADNPIAVRAYRRNGDASDVLRFKLYTHEDAVSLSDVMPMLVLMGLHVAGEVTYRVRPPAFADGEDRGVIWLHDFEMRSNTGALDFEVARWAFESAFMAIWSGRCENDGFNRLILSAGVGWRDVCFLRTCARYRRQTGLDPSQQVQEQALADNPVIAASILELKRVRFDPKFDGDMDARREAQEQIETSVVAALDDVASLDADRVLRRMWRLVCAIQRTNFYQTGADGQSKAHISIKIASREIDELPLPKPYREIFVWAPHVEGVHIRFGSVARGGLRWSDRSEDFRTEVLGLVKAQQVKNAVIVPVGSKGGFFPKQLPRGGTREEVTAEGVRAYRTFICGLLDITDNRIEGAVVHPDNTVRWDEDDPYLVVAADKGTATFSDIANEISEDYGFWLGDAFASGGSAGYDHKVMGITARGAWVAVQRHFREMGKNIQSEPFSVIGVGDMSGDVFGNGMLLSKHIRLLAAFNHMHIFIDPDPQDPKRLWEERKRVFDLGRSTWEDYDSSLISAGGGVFSRTAKRIKLTPQIKALTGLDVGVATPNELINALLKSEAELLWFGGIGTYVKSREEQDWQVGDKANDAVRVNAEDVRAKVLGEGANLGVTQAGRVALARRGMRLNADFIDNASGVDSSDHEVNIKILVGHEERSGRMDRAARNTLLESMTDDVAAHVLRHNYDQTLAISMAETTAIRDLDAHERLIQRLESHGLLNRAVEGLPTAEEFRDLHDQGLGLTRPELSVLISYAKIALFDRILNSTVPDDPHFASMLSDYFPPASRGFGEAMGEHPLRREIIATMLANDLINFGGATFAHRARESTGVDTDAVARGFEAARCIFGFSELVERINALDNTTPASVQADLHAGLIMLARRQTYWLVRRGRGFETEAPRLLNETIAAYKPGVDAMRAYAMDMVSPFERERVEAWTQKLVSAGAPEDLAREVAGLRPLMSASDVIDLSKRRGMELEPVARVYHALGDRFRFDRLRSVGGEMSSNLHWDRLAVRRLIEDLYAEQQRLVELALEGAGDAPVGGEDWVRDAIEAIAEANAYEVKRVDEVFAELDDSGPWTLSKMAIASTALREFASLATAK